MALHDDREALMSGADYDDEDAGRSGIRVVKTFLTALLIAGVVGLVWYAYNLGLRKGSESVAPVIQAGDQPVKVAPEDPGGLDVPNQDVAVYEAVEGEEGVERYVPPTLPDAGVSPDPAEPVQAPEAARQDTAEPATPSTGSGESAAPQAAAAPEADDAPAAQERTPANETPAAEAEPAAETQEAAVPEKGPSTAELIGPYRVQLAAYRTPEEATRTWLRLEEAHEDLLGALDLIIEKVDLGKDKGVFYRLQAAPLKSREAAESLCGKLKARKVSCIVVQA